MNNMQAMVKKFMTTAGYPVRNFGFDYHTLNQLIELPTGSSITMKKYLLDRRTWLAEEVMEYGDAVSNEDSVEIIDALADLLYFTFGTAVSLGIDLEEFFNAVHEANMEKFFTCKRCEGTGYIDKLSAESLGSPLVDTFECPNCHGIGKTAVYREKDGKLQKPANWKHADLLSILKDQRQNFSG